jgi:hypothetical protein
MLTVVWEKCAVGNPDGGADVVLLRGEALPDYVSDFLRSTLVQIGAVRDFGGIVQAAQDNVDAVLADEPLPPMYPPEVPPVTPAGPVESAAPLVVEKPSVTDNKATWESYAVYQGYLPQAEAESMTKANLMKAVNDRESL